MALQGHSPPPPFAPGLAGSPPRLMNGHPEHHFPPPMFTAHRGMLPPSPQQFPRYQPMVHAPMQHPGSLYEMKAPLQHHQQTPLNPHTRPGSSMSISSIMGPEPERFGHDLHNQHNQNNHNIHQQRLGTIGTPAMSVNAIMSPPHQPARAGFEGYPYKRTQTPDRFDHAFAGNRQRSASSGTSMALHRPGYDQDRYAKPPTPQFHAAAPFQHAISSREEQDERARRTSLSGILQRPNSQPHATAPLPQSARAFDVLAPQHQNWYADPPQPNHEPQRPNGQTGSYDTRPPGFRDIPRTVPISQSSPSISHPQTSSPEIRRNNNNAPVNRGLAGLLNGSSSSQSDVTSAPSHSMMRQDSAQSHSDRSILGDRNRFRHFSPFTGSVNAQMAGHLDDQNRKSSDEIPHKTIVGLGFENRRGRYSPVPQPVQGPQAHTPVPDGGVKNDQGKVFSGIGGGLGSSATPISASASPFKRDDSAPRPGDALKTGRSTTHTGKRSRKAHDDDPRADADADAETKKSAPTSKASKRSKYKADLEEVATPPLPRRGTPLAGGSSTRGTASLNAATSSGRYDAAPIFKPKKSVKVATVVSQTLRRPRRHLGTFQYQPQILVPEDRNSLSADHDICIKPRLMPSFSEADDLNCTYTIQVSRTWLQDRERKLICSSRNIWGTGVYTDDTDPVAAAMHMGWIKSAFHNADAALLKKIVHDQNPKVEISKELRPPSLPLETSKGRDLKITCVVMPLLDRYEETARFGMKSRSWPEGPETTPHDGVSFSIRNVEVVDIGPEEKRMGRTGQGKRARLQAQLLQMERDKTLEEERIRRLNHRLKERAKKQKQEEAEKKKALTRKAPSPLSNEVVMDDEPAVPMTNTAIDGDEWMRQLATAAA